MKITNNEIIEMLLHILEDVYIPSERAEEYSENVYNCAKNYITRILKNELNEDDLKRDKNKLEYYRKELQKCKTDIALLGYMTYKWFQD